MNPSVIIIAVIAIYLLFMLYIGFRSNKKGSTASQSEYYLGGRKIGPLVTAMSAEASDMSSYLLMGLPGLAYMTGLADVGWTCIGLAVGTYLNWLIVSRRLRRYSEQIGSITLPDFFSKRYHDKRNLLSGTAALFILIFFIPYTASGFKAIGALFHSLFGVDYHLAMLIGAAVVILYTIIGGFLAVSTTDLAQSIAMSAALVAIVVFGVVSAGGFDKVFENASALPGYLSMNMTYNPADGTASPYPFLTILSTLAWGLGYFGMPHILIRFMAIKNEGELRLSRRIASVWVVISMGIAILIGVIGLALSKEGLLEPLTTGADAETVIVRLADLMSRHGFLCAVFAGVTISGILASTMSTADSQLLQAASSFSKDILQDFCGVRMSNKASMMFARGTVLVISAVALLLAWNPDSSVFKIVSFAWAGFGGSFGPLVLFSLFWKRTTKAGALAGMIAGAGAIFLWKFAVRPLGGVFDLYELLPAFLLSSVVIVVVSLLTPAPDEQILREFEAGRKKV